MINLSLGADLHTNAERDAIKRAVAAGIVVVASAGNDGSLLPKFPAAYAGVLAVGAAGPDGKVAEFSNRGSWVGVLAPACGAAIDIDGSVDDAFCGTSAAAPFVSGLAGLLKSVAPEASGQDIIAAIQSSARRREGSAHGLVSAPAAIAAIKKIKPGSTTNTKGALLQVVKRPLISGVGAVGARLTTSTGVFSGNLTGIQIRWQRCSLTVRRLQDGLPWLRLSRRPRRPRQVAAGPRPCDRRGRDPRRRLQPVPARAALDEQRIDRGRDEQQRQVRERVVEEEHRPPA